MKTDSTATNLFYRAVLARFRAAIFLTHFRARSCEAFVPLGFSLSGDHGITGASSRNERFRFVTQSVKNVPFRDVF
jgi:hypothetical protein